MATFFLFGKYSPAALNAISPERTGTAVDLVKELRGEVKDMYALLGVHDVVLIVDMPDLEQAMQASVALARLTGIAFSTSPALHVDTFDELIKGI